MPSIDPAVARSAQFETGDMLAQFSGGRFETVEMLLLGLGGRNLPLFKEGVAPQAASFDLGLELEKS